MRRPFHHKDTLSVFFIFAFFVLLLLVGGLVVKAFLIFTHSSFDGTHQYILEMDDSSKSGEIVAFSPQKSSVVVLSFTGNVDSTYGTALGIPDDVVVHMSPAKNIDHLVQQLLLREANGMTILDKLHLLFFVNTLKQQNIRNYSYHLPLDVQTQQQTLPSLLQDPTIYNENISIAIVNASGVGGLGSKFAQMLTTIGGSVVSVTTADTVQNTTTITATTSSFTASKLSHLLGVGIQAAQGNGIAQITVTLGKIRTSQLQ